MAQAAGRWRQGCLPLLHPVDVTASQASLSSKAIMANFSEFSIVAYQRNPGHWRAAIFPEARTQSALFAAS
jgi:hypothetical protein